MRPVLPFVLRYAQMVAATSPTINTKIRSPGIGTPNEKSPSRKTSIGYFISFSNIRLYYLIDKISRINLDGLYCDSVCLILCVFILYMLARVSSTFSENRKMFTELKVSSKYTIYIMSLRDTRIIIYIFMSPGECLNSIHTR